MLSLGLSLTSVAVRGGGGQVSAAALMLASETQGLALDFTDDAFLSSTGLYGSARVKDTGTPANGYDSHPYGLLTYSSPSLKMLRGPSGSLRYGAHNLYLNSEVPADQSVTVVSGMTYQISVTGSVSITVSGAATGTVTDGNPVSFTAATTTLTCGSTSGSGTVHLRRTPSDDTYLKTTSAAAYELPYEWDVDGNPLGIRVEEQRTNLLTYSQEFDNAAWTKNSLSAAANAEVSPDGTQTMDKLVPAAANAFHTIRRTSITVAAAAHTVTFYAKAAGYNYIAVQLASTAAFTKYFEGVFNLSDGTIEAGSRSLTYTGSRSIDDLGGGVYRCRITVDTTDANSTAMVSFDSLGAAGDIGQSWTADGTSGVYIWGAQLEVGSFPTSYIPTAGSTVTRAADVLGPALTAFPWNSGTGTYDVDGVSETPADNGTILTLAPRSGETHIQTVKWVPSS